MPNDPRARPPAVGWLVVVSALALAMAVAAYPPARALASRSTRPPTQSRTPSALGAQPTTTIPGTTTTSVPTPCPSFPAQFQVASTLPTSFFPSSQLAANCFAWQEFFALNWVASTTTCGTPDTDIGATQFGEPNNTSPVVWESYKEASEVFLPGGVAPSGFCDPQTLPESVQSSAAARGQELRATSHRGHKALTMRNKFDANDVVDLSEYAEAQPTDSWLTAQSGYLTMYEIRMNQDEYNYITQNTLYDATVQPGFALSQGINLPDGSTTTYGTSGALEIKAAWLELDDPSLWPSYKTSQAIVSYPGETPRAVTVGLVGLHIIHKLPNAQQLIWATFEHINNAPSLADIQNNTLQPPYDYYNPTCDPNTDHYKCMPNQAPTVCQQGQQPPQCDPFNAPMQVVRETSLTPDAINANQNAWNAIRAANPDSVFLNYALVSTLWPNQSSSVGVPGASVPLALGNPQPQNQTIANTVIETYVQQSTCFDCHKYATIATPSMQVRKIPKAAPVAVGANATSSTTTTTPPPCSADNPVNCAADFSFLLSHAQASAEVGAPQPDGETGDGGGSSAGLVVAVAVLVVLAGAAVVGVAARRRRGGEVSS
jgi:hypothetical protein